MPFVEDENGNHILDDDGNKIIFSVSYEVDNEPYIHREPLHIDDNGHVNTKNRNIIIKDGVDANHAVSKSQLDHVETTIRSELLALTTAINKLKSDLQKLSKPEINE